MKRSRTQPPHEPQAPFFVGVDIGKQMHYAVVVDAGGSPCLPKAIAFTNTHEGYAQLYVAIEVATAQAPASQVTVGVVLYK